MGQEYRWLSSLKCCNRAIPYPSPSPPRLPLRSLVRSPCQICIAVRVTSRFFVVTAAELIDRHSISSRRILHANDLALYENTTSITLQSAPWSVISVSSSNQRPEVPHLFRPLTLFPHPTPLCSTGCAVQHIPRRRRSRASTPVGGTS